MPLTLICAVPFVANAQPKLQSMYTELAEKKCKTISSDKETGSSTQRCNGVGGYKLLVHDDDARQSITIVDPSAKEHPLNFWSVMTHSFSSVGDKAEWRVSKSNGKVTPVGLIVRVNASENPEKPSSITSYLAVAKVSANGSCVTHRIRSGPNANAQARTAADSAATAPCLKELGQ